MVQKLDFKLPKQKLPYSLHKQQVDDLSWMVKCRTVARTTETNEFSLLLLKYLL